MPDMELIQRPEIRLVGSAIENGIEGTNFSGIVDHFKMSPSRNPSSTSTTIQSESHLDKDNILTFKESVRIIITGRVNPKPPYTRKTRNLGSLEFEGKQRYSIGDVNYYAETYYTINGKDPIKSANYLYKYKDYDDFKIEYRTHRIEITQLGADPSGKPVINPSVDDDQYSNINELGIVFKNHISGSNVITIKARTFYQGNVSEIAMAYFKIYREVNSPVFDNADNND